MSARAGSAASAGFATATTSHNVFEFVYSYQSVMAENTLRKWFEIKQVLSVETGELRSDARWESNELPFL